MVIKFSKSHEGASADGIIATVGISEYAQSQLGDVVFVELPEVGAVLAQFAQMGTIESTKAASELSIPVGGEILEVNEDLAINPQRINESAMEAGWLVKVKLSDVSQLDRLMDSTEYEKFVNQEKHWSCGGFSVADQPTTYLIYK